MTTPFAVDGVTSFGVVPAEVTHFSPYSGTSRQDAKTCKTSRCAISRDKLKKIDNSRYIKTVTNPESGSYVPFDVLSTGSSGTRDYDRAMLEAKLARENPTLLAMSVNKDLDIAWHEPVVPKKPKPVTVAGLSVFGDEGPTSTVHNMTTDMRGEAVERYAIGPPPEGASVSGRMGPILEQKRARIDQQLPKDMQRCAYVHSCRDDNMIPRNVTNVNPRDPAIFGTLTFPMY